MLSTKLKKNTPKPSKTRPKIIQNVGQTQEMERPREGQAGARLTHAEFRAGTKEMGGGGADARAGPVPRDFPEATGSSRC